MVKFRYFYLCLSVLAAIGVIFSIAAIPATWLGKALLKQELETEIALLQSDLSLFGDGLANMRLELQDAQVEIDVLQNVIAQAGLDAEEDARRLADIISRITGVITPVLDQASNAVDKLREIFIQVKDAIAQLNELPLLELHLPGGSKIDELAADLVDVRNGIDNLQQRISQVSKTTQDTLIALTTGFASLEESLQSLLARLDDVEPRLQARQQQLTSLVARLPGILNLSAVVLTLFLIWFGFSQVMLFERYFVLWEAAPKISPTTPA